MKRRIVTQALSAFLATYTSKQVGVIVAPALPVHPYAILYPIDGTAESDDFANSGRQIQTSYQVTSVGQNYEQAEWMADFVRQAMKDWSVAIPLLDGSAHVGDVVARFTDGGPSVPDDVPEQMITSIPERFKLWLDAP